MYESYWGLRGAPFEPVPDPRMLYLAEPHEDALLIGHHFFARREGVALLTGAPFTEDALAEIDRLTGGVPRAVVQTADAALLYGMSESLSLIDRSALRAMTQDTTFAATGETARLAA